MSKVYFFHYSDRDGVFSVFHVKADTPEEMVMKLINDDPGSSAMLYVTMFYNRIEGYRNEAFETALEEIKNLVIEHQVPGYRKSKEHWHFVNDLCEVYQWPEKYPYADFLIARYLEIWRSVIPEIVDILFNHFSDEGDNIFCEEVIFKDP